MPVATVPTYDDMWVDPKVVAALSNGVFTYLDVEDWNAAANYDRCDSVLHGTECPYGGCVWTATVIAPAGTPGPATPGQTTWVLDEAATTERLRLYTATMQATWLLDTLTGYKLHGEECWVEDYKVHTCTIRLRRQPVDTITSVVRVHRCNSADTAQVADWCRDSVTTISLCCMPGQPVPWYPGFVAWDDPYAVRYACGCGDTVRVTYKISSNLPPGTEALCAWLATEYGKAASGQACALPERITNVTRQGVSWTVLDPQDFLDKGFTGMSRLDNWLAPVKKTLGGELIDPLTSTRLFSRQINCATLT